MLSEVGVSIMEVIPCICLLRVQMAGVQNQSSSITGNLVMKIPLLPPMLELASQQQENCGGLGYLLSSGRLLSSDTIVNHRWIIDAQIGKWDVGVVKSHI